MKKKLTINVCILMLLASCASEEQINRIRKEAYEQGRAQGYSEGKKEVYEREYKKYVKSEFRSEIQRRIREKEWKYNPLIFYGGIFFILPPVFIFTYLFLDGIRYKQSPISAAIIIKRITWDE